MATARCTTLSVSCDVSASLFRINCSQAREFLVAAVHAASNATAVVTHAIVSVRIFIDVPFFKPSAIVAYGPVHGHWTGVRLDRSGIAPLPRTHQAKMPRCELSADHSTGLHEPALPQSSVPIGSVA